MKLPTIHRLKEKHPHFYQKWKSLQQRCLNNPVAVNYKNYAKKGIKVEWKNRTEFIKDMYESYLLHVHEHGEKNTTLDRIDNNKGYYKENCRWATWSQQLKNRSPYVLKNKLDLETVKIIRFLRERYQWKYAALAKLYGTSQATISHLVVGRTWKS